MSDTTNFFTLLSGDDVRTNIVSVISAPLWSDGVAKLDGTSGKGFNTSSVQYASSGDYYIDVYHKDPASETTAEVQFAVAYGHIDGSGSLTTSAGNNPTKAIYSQFRNICLPANSTKLKFNFDGDALDGNGVTPTVTEARNQIFVITANRARYREKMDPGNWELHISGSHPAINPLKLIDDSGATEDSSVKASHRVFNVVSGSIAGDSAVIKQTAAAQAALDANDIGSGSYGLFFPELGTIILNGYAIGGDAGITITDSASTNDDTVGNLYRAISSSAYFQGRREEQIKSSHYFCRIKSSEYNYSQNPTYYSGSDAALTNPTFIANPKSYITTVGLYNSNNDLIAVAKLSKPLLKSSDREAVIKVRLDF